MTAGGTRHAVFFGWVFNPPRGALPVQSLRDSAAATPAGCAAWGRRFRIFSFRLREMMSGMTMVGEKLDFLRRMRQFWENGAIILPCFRKPLRMHSHVCRRDSHL